MTGDLTAKPKPSQAESGTPQAEPTTKAEVPPVTEPGSPNPAPSLSQLAAHLSAPEFLEQVLAAPKVPAAVTEVEAKALIEPAAGPEAPPAAGPEAPPAAGPEAPPAAGPEAPPALGPEAPPAAGPEAPPAAGPEAPPAAGPEAPPAAGPEAPPAAPRETGDRWTGDKWLEWFLPVLAIALPAFILIVIPYALKHITTWGEVDLSAQRGDYLIPVLILCAETVRRWCREVKCRGRLLRTVRFTAVSVCAFALVVCFASAIVAVEFTPTPASGRSLVTITAWCLIPSFVFGTFAVVAPQKEPDR